MFNFFIKRTVESINVLWLVILTFFVAGCAMRGTWYHPQAPVGHAKNRLCQTTGRNNEWVVKRQGVVFYISVLQTGKNRGAGVNVSVTVPAGRTVHVSLQNFRAYGPLKKMLKSNSVSKVSVSGAYIFHDATGNHVRSVHYLLPPTIQVLSGDRAASKTFPSTGYGYGFSLQKNLPLSLDIVLPRMKINGHRYPPLTIHFTKKTGTYFVMGINC